ncbi:MAG: LD-carboxypeptidase [Betaproteobacteria bacterium]|nr:LD-carboxypeptidase [Betaproteobacteria bacterium]
MNRREFLAGSALAALSLSGCATRGRDVAASGRALIKPPRLKPRALVGLVAPSGVVTDATIQRCVTNLEALGFSVKTSANIRKSWGGYAGPVRDRVDDLHAMFADREVAGLWVARGGSGAAALLPHLDYGLIARNPKILVGYSDITALHLAIQRHAGLVTFHGPGAGATQGEYSLIHQYAMLMSPRPSYRMGGSPLNQERGERETAFKRHRWTGGVAEGRLTGGNLSVLVALIGTPYAPVIRDSLLCLEEVSEAPYRIDRMLTHMHQSLGLDTVAGAALGVFSRCEPRDNEPSLTLREVLDNHFANSPVPAAYGFSFGHIAENLTLPFGIRARMDADEDAITLLEPAVA